jgi:putative restriction endonuclease
MPAVVLESAFGSQYEDTPDSYEFPSAYLRHFAPVTAGAQLFAIIYEPRGGRGSGRMAYVGWAEIVSGPQPTGRKNKAGQSLWRVIYRRPAEPFDHDVPREVQGEPVETWLRGIPRGRPRNVATFGRAVRPLLDADFERIMHLGGGLLDVGGTTYPTADEHMDPAYATRERVERVVNVYERRAAFRREVLGAYELRCAVSGLGLGSVSATRTVGVLDAAHVKPVGANGEDSVWNGLALTPTLHRMFDLGLFSLRYVDDHLEVLVSPRLERGMVEVPERGVGLSLADGTKLLLPNSRAMWPKMSMVDYHRSKIFVSS